MINKYLQTIGGGALILFVVLCGGCGKSVEQSTTTASGKSGATSKAQADNGAPQPAPAGANTNQPPRKSSGAAAGPKVDAVLRKIMADADARQEVGRKLLLATNQTTEAAATFKAAAKLYQQALELRKFQPVLAKAEQDLAVARSLAEAAGNLDALAAAEKMQAAAEGDLEAGEPVKALADYAKTQQILTAPGAGAGMPNSEVPEGVLDRKGSESTALPAVMARAQKAGAAAALLAADDNLTSQPVAGQFPPATKKPADTSPSASCASLAADAGDQPVAGATAKSDKTTANGKQPNKLGPDQFPAAKPKSADAPASADAIPPRAPMGVANGMGAADEPKENADKPATDRQYQVAAWQGPQKNLTVNLGNGVTMQLMLIRPGTFQMGSAKNRNEQPVHAVTITTPFYIGEYEVTQEQWQQVMGSNPSNFKGAKNPVEMVSWNDCQDFLAKLNTKAPEQQFNLPTEAQWEYACRAGRTGDYCYGDGDGELDDYAWSGSNANGKPHPVGEKQPNAWGLHDMHGNVWEWCQDVYHPTYKGAPPDGSVWIQDGEATRVLRGGMWGNSATDLRSAARLWAAPGQRNNLFGVRVVAAIGIQ